MEFQHSEKVRALVEKLTAFRDTHIIPNEAVFAEQVADGATRFKPAPILEDLRARAKKEGLWNLFLKDETHGHGLTNLEYAPLAEIMGCNEWAPEVFNCNPPDTGNMEVLARYGNEAQKQQWLMPLYAGEIRSCFAMTEPGVASSDATNISTRAELRDGEWVINGEKWWISGPGNPLCKIAIAMVKSNPENDRHKQHSMILIPLEAEGVTIKRQLTVLGFDYAPRGHVQLKFDNVRVPQANVLLGPGRGFEIAQGRLGPGRLHHAMRCVGAAERALSLMCQRGLARTAFGKPIATLGGNFDVIAKSRLEIEMVRLFVLKAAWLLDTQGPKGAKVEVSGAKILAAHMACQVVDRAMQLHGAAGLSQDTPLAALYARLRTLRIADGPDEAHWRTIAKAELEKHGG